nr:MAG TPA: hypothetical protein [Caudoviricetes sp.]
MDKNRHRSYGKVKVSYYARANWSLHACCCINFAVQDRLPLGEGSGVPLWTDEP